VVHRFDVAVVGAGAAGGATALFLARRGRSVLLLERFDLNHVFGSSHGRTRILRCAYSEGDQYVPLVHRARALWLELGRETGRELFRPIGALILGEPQSRVVAGAVATARALELPHEVLDAKTVRSRFPAFMPDEAEVAVWDPMGGAVFPERCLETMVEGARAAGAHVRFREPMREFRASRDRVFVRSDREEYEADQLVLAVGSWLPSTVPGLGVPMEVERQAVFWFRPRGEASRFAPERMPAFVWQRRAVGYYYGLPDFGDGVKAASDEGSVAASPEAVPRIVTESDEAPVRAFVGARLPGADGPVADRTTCIYTNTPDRRFLLDTHPAHSNVWIASACSGHGFKFASAVGESLATWIADGRRPPELAPFAHPAHRPAGPNLPASARAG
jgi:sarcosine oxidase